MIFAHLPKSIFQIATAESFTVESGLFLNNRFYTRDTLNYPVGLLKRYLEREISASHFLLCIWCFASSCFSIVSIDA